MKYKKDFHYELWEVDTVLRKLLEKVGDEKDLEIARKNAQKLAEGWCVDEKPEKEFYAAGCELWIGNSDFGILIKKIKNK